MNQAFDELKGRTISAFSHFLKEMSDTFPGLSAVFSFTTLLYLKFQFMVNGQHLDLVHGSQGGINVSPCWSHPCSVQNATVSSPCGLQGTCKPIMNDYSCECPLGLTGARCEHVLSPGPLADVNKPCGFFIVLMRMRRICFLYWELPMEINDTLMRWGKNFPAFSAQNRTTGIFQDAFLHITNALLPCIPQS